MLYLFIYLGNYNYSFLSVTTLLCPIHAHSETMIQAEVF